MDITREQVIRLATIVIHDTSLVRMTAGEIVDHALTPQMLQQLADHRLPVNASADRDELSIRVARLLNNYVKNTSSAKREIDGTKHGWRLGKAAKLHQSSTVSTNFLGSAGEHAFISELLSEGWNATRLATDDGVDVIATKDGKIRTVQIKTTVHKWIKQENFEFNIKIDSFERHDNPNHYYVFVMRRRLAGRHVNDYLLLTSGEITHHTIQAVIRRGESSLQVRVQRDGDIYHLVGTKSLEVSDKVNHLDSQFR